MSRGPHPSAGPLCERVIALCDSLISTPCGREDEIRAIRARLGEPLRIAVAGRVSSGKSTLVNALLGCRIAQTGITETTRVITRYLAGDVERVEVKLISGEVRRLALTFEGQLPPELGAPPDQVLELTVQLPKPSLLRWASLIDTPGLSSAEGTSSGVTTKHIFTSMPTGSLLEAEALLFAVDGPGMQDDLDAVAAFSQVAAGLASSALNTIGVITKADAIASEAADPIAAADTIARRRSELPELRSRVIKIIPVIGILAETARSGAITYRELDELRSAAQTDPAGPIEDWQDFVDRSDTPLRRHLVDLLKPFGLTVALEAFRNGIEDSEALEQVLVEASGVLELESVLRRELMPRADSIKADQALAALKTMAYGDYGVESQRLRDAIEVCMLDPAMHPLRELAALNEIADGSAEVPLWVEAELRRLVLTRYEHLDNSESDSQRTEQSVGDLLRRVAMFASAGTTSHPAGQVADVLKQSYVQEWQRTRDLAPAARQPEAPRQP